MTAKNTLHPADRNAIESLLAGVQYALDNPENSLECAVWRLVDAAGLVYRNVHPVLRKGLAGVDQETGRGFRLSGSKVSP